MTEKKTEAIDALKGKVEFAKTHQTHDAIYTTMNKVEDIITGYTDLWQEDVRYKTGEKGSPSRHY